MNIELKKRIITSIGLLFLLATMYFYSFIMIGALLIMAIIIWIEFYALISKIISPYKLMPSSDARYLSFTMTAGTKPIPV